MEELNWKNLKIWISSLTPEKYEYCLENGILPIFTTRTLVNSSFVSGLNETSVHIPELSPSGSLRKEFNYEGTIDEHEFRTRYILELNKLYLPKILKKIDLMREVSGAESVALLGYSSDHIKILAEYINSLGILNDEIVEL